MALGSQPLGVSHPHSTSQNSQPTFPTYFPGGVGLALHGPALLAQPFAAACASAADCASAALASACARRSAASALADALSAKNSAASMAEADRSSSYGRAHGVRGSGFGIRREEGRRRGVRNVSVVECSGRMWVRRNRAIGRLVVHSSFFCVRRRWRSDARRPATRGATGPRQSRRGPR